ncbi:uncharacterized protein LOC120358468 [Solenopsis invicta]|uniref:uncharacterized protein LOC120358468 n=1 Tax=Solenopsis invicta TaxID=13686 RepID=UPI00193DA56F|nr:uncharacterized protein LOC120358468 [Solenopsis invicta]
MSVLMFTFKVLTICGCWPPNSWTSRCKRILYVIYTILIALLINTFTLSQLLDLILIVADDFAGNFYITLAMFASCCKMFSLLRNCNNIAMLIDILIKKPCKPTEHDKIEIRQKFDKLVQFYYATMVKWTCAFALVTSVFKDYRKHRLIFRAWLPFSYFLPMLFRIAYAHQAISLTAGSVLHVACDSIICGLLMHICSQLEILECHLKKVINKPHLLRECVIQHTYIFQLIF